MTATIEDARKARPGSVWFKTASDLLLLERTQRFRAWVLWHTYRDGRRLDSFDTKRAAMAVAAHMADYMPQMNRTVEIDEQGTGHYQGEDETERKRLVTLTNDEYLTATREARR